MKQKTIELAQALIRRPSISPNDEGCQQLIAERLEKLGFQIEWMPFNDTLNLWAKHGAGEPVIAFAGHTDVVPTGDETQWTYPPFSAEIVDDILYGRGAADMKGSLAAMIVAAEEYVKANPNHKGTIALLITSDEEAAAKDGTVRVVETLIGRRGAGALRRQRVELHQSGLLHAGVERQCPHGAGRSDARGLFQPREL